MAVIGLVVPVMVNFRGFAELMQSVDHDIHPIIIDNWNENKGVSGGWNIGLKRARDLELSSCLVVNDDVIFSSGTIGKLWARSGNYDLITASNDKPMEGVDDQSADFSCFMVNPMTFFDKFGTFDENFLPAYFEDNDMAYRIKVLGGRYGKHLNATIEHKGSVTQNWKGRPFVSSKMFETNKIYYATKWGGTPGLEQYKVPFNGLTGKTARDW